MMALRFSFINKMEGGAERDHKGGLSYFLLQECENKEECLCKKYVTEEVEFLTGCI